MKLITGWNNSKGFSKYTMAIATVAVVLFVAGGYLISSLRTRYGGGVPPAGTVSRSLVQVAVATPLPSAPALLDSMLRNNKARILALAAKSSLTPSEKNEVLDMIGGENVLAYNFKPEELQKVLSALNKP